CPLWSLSFAGDSRALERDRPPGRAATISALCKTCGPPAPKDAANDHVLPPAARGPQTTMAARVCSCFALSFLVAVGACDKGDDAKSERQPPPGPPPSASSSAGPAVDVCAGGGGQDTDAVS